MNKELFVDDFDRLKNRRYPGDNYDKIISQPRAFWFGWNRYDKQVTHGKSINRLLNRAGNKIVTLVLYNATNRDENHYSKGGANSIEEYKQYVDDFANAIDRECIVIVEPDALPHAFKFNGDAKQERFECLAYAVSTLVKTPAKVYIDVGHPDWLTPYAAAKMIKQSKIKNFRGFSVNVSNFASTEKCINWANKVCTFFNDMYYIIDTSRNGAEVNGWCNPKGAKLGHIPTFDTGNTRCDAFLWIKIPGESDGKDGSGAPHAGKFYPAYADMLTEN